MYKHRYKTIKRIGKIIYQVVYKMTHRYCVFEKKTEFGVSCKFEGKNYISQGTFLNDVEMGYGTYTGYNCHILSSKIGRYSSIGPNVKTYIGTHPTSRFVSTHPAFYTQMPVCGFSYVREQKFKEVNFAYDDGEKKYAIQIGNDVWIGAGVSIIDGVIIGDGAVIGANSLVTEDVAPYSVVVGTPAKEIRKRFNPEQIEMLQNLKWWDKNEEWIKENGELFEDIDIFLDRFSKS